MLRNKIPWIIMNLLLLAVTSFGQGSFLFAKSTGAVTSKSIHITPTVGFGYKTNLWDIGPDFLIIQKPLGDPVNVFVNQSIGAHIGYLKYFSKQEEYRFAPYFKLDVSVFNYKSKPSSHSPVNPGYSTNTYVFNGGAIGCLYRFLPHWNWSLDIGVSAYKGFFLFFEDPCFYASLGLRYDWYHFRQKKP